MDCVACGSAAATERPERTAQGYRRFRCRDCGKQYNERSGGLLNHTQYPSDSVLHGSAVWTRGAQPV
jgi:putative transposase